MVNSWEFHSSYHNLRLSDGHHAVIGVRGSRDSPASYLLLMDGTKVVSDVFKTSEGELYTRRNPERLLAYETEMTSAEGLLPRHLGLLRTMLDGIKGRDITHASDIEDVFN